MICQHPSERVPVMPVVFREYGCVLCQRYHREGRDELYAPHLYRQAKHTYREVDVEEAIVEAFARAGETN